MKCDTTEQKKNRKHDSEKPGDKDAGEQNTGIVLEYTGKVKEGKKAKDGKRLSNLTLSSVCRGLDWEGSWFNSQCGQNMVVFW